MAIIGEAVRRLLYFGLRRYCVLCGSRLRRFLPFGDPPRREALCPICDSLERHRAAWMYFRRKTDLFDGKPKRLLHFAPELQMARRFRGTRRLGYVGADLNPRDNHLRLDIVDITFPDASFDVIYCSHVLEHVPDDRKAMSELYRVLKPGGWAVLQVPIKGDVTLEDPSITCPSERRRLFGQEDHVRQYGRDYRDRLREAGFAVQVDLFVETLTPTRIRYYGLAPGDDIYLCRRRPMGAAQ